MKYNGSTWETVVVSENSIDNGYSIIVFDGTPYMLYKNPENFKITVTKYNGSTWETVGNSEFSIGQADHVSLVGYNEDLYVTYKDTSNFLKPQL
jgi:hypothetical protein